MGTNYYIEMESPCPCCGRGGEPMHIGKSSAGWCFSLHIYPEHGINCLEDWKTIFSYGRRIYDEYGKDLIPEQMLDRIENRGREPTWDQKPYGYNSWEEFHRDNHSEQGPNGLLRHKYDQVFCLGHGEGTYDYLVGEFS